MSHRFEMLRSGDRVTEQVTRSRIALLDALAELNNRVTRRAVDAESCFRTVRETKELLKCRIGRFDKLLNVLTLEHSESVFQIKLDNVFAGFTCATQLVNDALATLLYSDRVLSFAWGL